MRPGIRSINRWSNTNTNGSSSTRNCCRIVVGLDEAARWLAVISTCELVGTLERRRNWCGIVVGWLAVSGYDVGIDVGIQ